MEVRDLFVTPIILVLILLLAIVIRPKLASRKNKKYFIPALLAKIGGGIAVGLIYQFYYGTGDTFNYFLYGSRHVYDAFWDNPLIGLKLVFADGSYNYQTFEYSSQIWTYHDMPSYFVVRVAGVLDLFTGHTYSATAALFAFFSFLGNWSMYRTLDRLFPAAGKGLVIAVLFVPSVVFWGSGILKDTITLGALGFLFSGMVSIIIDREYRIGVILKVIIAAWVIFSVKVYILLCFIPATALLWVSDVSKGLKTPSVKFFITPLFFLIAVGGGYLIINEIGKSNQQYSIDSLQNTAERTARWLNHVSDKEKGSGYALGDFDYSLSGTAKKIPLAVWVSLFRPHPWEVKNPIMLLSSLEGTFLLFLFLQLILKSGIKKVFEVIKGSPMLIFCFTFTIVFAIAVGMTSYNFGTLVRYKIPLLPFFTAALFIVRSQLLDKKRLIKKKTIHMISRKEIAHV